MRTSIGMRAIIPTFLLATLTFAALGCDDDDDGYGPGCVGLPRGEAYPVCDTYFGSACRSDRDCAEECCEEKHCGREGMCTSRCGSDRDCPEDMLCEHDVCLFACATDRDCAPGWKCGHGGRVCEAE